jgi:hypothetical protein
MAAPVAGYIRDMVDRPDRVCMPIEMEMLPLYREPRGSARLRRELKREQRRERREKRKCRRTTAESAH